jgi:hypothetical protein
MSWIKRNLLFVAGSAVAIVLLGLAGFYFFSRWSLDKKSLENLEVAYADLQRISDLNPNPGNDKVDNIKLAREQQAQVRVEIRKVQKFFAPIPPIPNPTNGVVTKENFASSLRRTIDQLQKDAALGGVNLPPRYDFSFQAQRNLPNFAPGSLPPLAAQLGDIKTFCRILFQAKVNSLDAVRRERVSTDDHGGPQADYLDATHISVTNELAVVVPYEVVFQSFSAELAATLAGFGTGDHGIVVKSVNVEPAGGVSGGFDPASPYQQPGGTYVPGYYPEGRIISDAPNPYTRVPQPVTPAQPRGGLQTVLDEKPLRVTLVINVVRLLPRK